MPKKNSYRPTWFHKLVLATLGIGGGFSLFVYGIELQLNEDPQGEFICLAGLVIAMLCSFLLWSRNTRVGPKEPRKTGTQAEMD